MLTTEIAKDGGGGVVNTPGERVRVVVVVVKIVALVVKDVGLCWLIRL